VIALLLIARRNFAAWQVAFTWPVVVTVVFLNLSPWLSPIEARRRVVRTCYAHSSRHFGYLRVLVPGLLLVMAG
jgi:hypothetical protein